MKEEKKKKLIDWIKEHARPHIRYKNKGRDSGLNIEDSWGSMSDKIKENTEVGIKFQWKF
jgi:hypothetical protein